MANSKNSTTPFQDATRQMSLTPQEQNLYMHHLNNLLGPGKVVNPSGSISTMLQAVVPGPGGRYYNIPTVWDGQAVDIRTAAGLAAQQGWNNWPSYRTPDEADLRYERMHDFLDRDTESYRQATTPIGSFKRGGKVKKTGVYKLHKGEVVTAAAAQKTATKRLVAAKRPSAAARKPAAKRPRVTLRRPAAARRPARRRR